MDMWQSYKESRQTVVVGLRITKGLSEGDINIQYNGEASCLGHGAKYYYRITKKFEEESAGIQKIGGWYNFIKREYKIVCEYRQGTQLLKSTVWRSVVQLRIPSSTRDVAVIRSPKEEIRAERSR